MMGKTRLPGFLLGVTAVVLALSAACASAASNRTLLELKTEGKPLAVGGEVLLVAGYSLGPCYWEEQEFKVAVNRSKADKLVRTGGSARLSARPLRRLLRLDRIRARALCDRDAARGP